MHRVSIRAAFVALLVAGSLIGVVEAATIVVDDDGLQCPGALTTIQDAVNAAAPGDTIRVCPGSYFEEVIVDKANLRITGAGRVVLSAPLLGISPFGFGVSAPGVLIERFEVTGYAECGIGVAADSATIQSNNVHNNHSNICIGGSAHTVVRANRVGESVEESITATDITENEISGNRIVGGDSGIFLTGDSGSTIHHNLVLFVRKFAIGVDASAGSAIRNNTVRLVGAVGIVAAESTQVEVVSNSAEDSFGAGLLVFECTQCTVSRNSVTHNNIEVLPDFAGILLGAVDQSTISQNSAHRNGVVDCSWDGAGTNVFVRNACGVEVPPGAWD